MSIAAVALADVGDSLREAFFMFWATLWALVLGFALSGAVQAFVSHDDMQRVLGDHRPATIVKASGLGMVSSSCSYAASAMAKSLFQKGADFIAAMAFMFASTNLVLELGVVLLALMGWQFALAEFVGGPIMIALFSLVGAVVFRRAHVDAARRRLVASSAARHDDHQAALERAPWREKLTSRAAWSDAARYTMADIAMLKRELVIGYAVAGGLTVLVPVDVWNRVFFHGHGGWTTVENVLVAPFIACVSFVCSIGNVPMAAALWHGGIGFGGVISFIFADLVAFPLVLIYRKYYGTRLALRLFVSFWLVMAAAGLIVELLFGGLGVIPTDRPADVVPTGFAWNETTALNIVFIGVFAVLFWLHRQRPASDGDHEPQHATDPMCGMQVRIASAPATRRHDGMTTWFCSDRCADRFDAARPTLDRSRPGG